MASQTQIYQGVNFEAVEVDFDDGDNTTDVLTTLNGPCIPIVQLNDPIAYTSQINVDGFFPSNGTTPGYLKLDKQQVGVGTACSALVYFLSLDAPRVG